MLGWRSPYRGPGMRVRLFRVAFALSRAGMQVRARLSAGMGFDFAWCMVLVVGFLPSLTALWCRAAAWPLAPARLSVCLPAHLCPPADLCRPLTSARPLTLAGPPNPARPLTPGRLLGRSPLSACTVRVGGATGWRSARLPPAVGPDHLLAPRTPCPKSLPGLPDRRCWSARPVPRSCRRRTRHVREGLPTTLSSRWPLSRAGAERQSRYACSCAARPTGWPACRPARSDILRGNRRYQCGLVPSAWPSNIPCAVILFGPAGAPSFDPGPGLSCSLRRAPTPRRLTFGRLDRLPSVIIGAGNSIGRLHYSALFPLVRIGAKTSPRALHEGVAGATGGRFGAPGRSR